VTSWYERWRFSRACLCSVNCLLCELPLHGEPHPSVSQPTEGREQRPPQDTRPRRRLSSDKFEQSLADFKDPESGGFDADKALSLLKTFWSAVKATFPDAWGLPPKASWRRSRPTVTGPRGRGTWAAATTTSWLCTSVCVHGSRVTRVQREAQPEPWRLPSSPVECRGLGPRLDQRTANVGVDEVYALLGCETP
jgi:hypothetical protein